MVLYVLGAVKLRNHEATNRIAFTSPNTLLIPPHTMPLPPPAHIHHTYRNATQGTSTRAHTKSGKPATLA